ncbi:MAG: hypothetical protein COA78_24000 [Blastopirellula sp.]|nr:MAG: hypothetical protein COA78_24000 [Blastopirellula sp.]
MTIIFGTRLYGKVDKTTEGYYIATSFFHLFYFPLLPLGSYLITKKGWIEWEGVDLVAFYSKSTLVGYLRGISVSGIIALAFGIGYLISEPECRWSDFICALIAISLGAIGLLAFILSYLFSGITTANPELNQHLNLLGDEAKKE